MGVKGKFITFEGSEGSGKSTQIELAHQFLKAHHKDVLFLREPGGVKISEAIRAILLDAKNKEMCAQSETLLYMAARAQLVNEVIEPALKKGKIILCDRFLDSTTVYQGFGHGIDIKFIKQVGRFATRGILPDLTFILDIEAKKGLARIHRAKDRIEQKDLSYHNKVRNGYLTLARQEPKRVKLISGAKSREEIQLFVQKHITQFLKLKS